MRLKSEDELLIPEVRAQLVSEIEARENHERKLAVFRKTQLYKDQTKRMVIDQLIRQFDQQTVDEMDFVIANLSIGKKVVNKLAKVYAHGARREITDDKASTESLQKLEEKLDFNSKMKVTNRWLKLNRNTVVHTKPIPFKDKEGNLKRTITIQALNPHLYDAIEQFHDRTQPLAYILSNFEERSLRRVSIEPSKEGRTINTPQSVQKGNKRDEGIADKKVDEDSDAIPKTYIVWSDKWHFTMNESGEIVDPADPKTAMKIDPTNEESLKLIANPIEEMPFQNFAIDQDNSFWAEGGDDLADGAILINVMISHIMHVGICQGYGQLVATGKNMPKQWKKGPTIAWVFEYDKDEDPKPEVQYISSAPPMADLMRSVELYTALLLTTNNLSTSGFSTDLQGGQSFPSGIALMIDKSESQEDIQDQQQIFLDNEPEIWRKYNKWAQLYSEDGTLDEELKELVLPDGFDENFVLKFPEPDILQSEQEKLANIEKRKNLGINTMVELLMKDNPDLTDKQALKKLTEIEKEKLRRMNEMMGGKNVGGNDSSDDTDDASDSDTPNDNPPAAVEDKEDGEKE